MPRTRLFIDSPELYDAAYHFKNYARECDRLRSLINETLPGTLTILDVACGTAFALAFLLLSSTHETKRIKLSRVGFCGIGNTRG